MPLQNRVDPFSLIQLSPHRGTCMGNRGILHDDRQNIEAYHRHKNWIICRLERQLKSGQRVRRRLMSPGKYTELFFLDEAAALAAGHRPCAECNRARYNEFVRLWRQANPTETQAIDAVLHQERFRPYQSEWRRKKRTYLTPIDELPYGALITLTPDPGATPYLVDDDTLRPWSFAGYGDRLLRPAGLEVTLLTPPSTVAVLAAGYRPQVYPEPY